MSGDQVEPRGLQVESAASYPAGVGGAVDEARHHHQRKETALSNTMKRFREPSQGWVVDHPGDFTMAGSIP